MMEVCPQTYIRITASKSAIRMTISIAMHQPDFVSMTFSQRVSFRETSK